MTVKIACQTIVYGNPFIKDNYDSILASISAIGYDGVETGARHFYMDRPNYYADLFARYNLEPVAIHVGGDFLDRDSVAKQIENIDNTIQFAKKLGVRYLYLSGTFREVKTIEDYEYEAKVYEEIGRRCYDAGLILCYHNHAWEMTNNMMGMKVLLDKVDPRYMKLVPDVGWIAIAGIDPVKFVKDNIERVEAVHFKDFKGPNMFTELGTGIVDFKAIYKCISQYLGSKEKEFWIIAEQDETDRDPAESAKINYNFIKTLTMEG